MIKQYCQLSTELPTELPNQVGSGLNGKAARSYARGYTNQYVFLPSDPDELVDQLKLPYFEKLEGYDSFLLNEQIIATVDKLSDAAF